jgi:ASC-1-like (ASCH) protein
MASSVGSRPQLQGAALGVKSVTGKPAYKSLTLKKIYIQQIRGGRKTTEGRIFKGPAANLKAGGLVRFYYYTNAKDDVTCRITKISRYSTFKAMLEDKGFAGCVPDAQDLTAAVKAYASIPGYPEKEKKFGVVAIDLMLC